MRRLVLGLSTCLLVGTAPAPREITIARLQYEGGGDWYANPSSLPNLIAAVRTRTSLRVSPQELRLRPTDDRLFDAPFVHLTGHGEIKLTDADVVRLREYLLRGGFLHADDNYGLDPSFRREIARVFPDRPLVEVPTSHPVYRAVYPLRGLPKIHEHDGKPPRGYGIFIGDRLAVFYSHESDLGNGWEDVGTYPEDPPEKHEQALRMGVNLVVYAVTSRPAS
ncbi:MAG: DUF4159 domain-containing protein [Gemmatimonadaceae bacterium]|nr:DUF4159 domain-containing protein [Gemmatimonadaceae bacterium]